MKGIIIGIILTLLITPVAAVTISHNFFSLEESQDEIQMPFDDEAPNSILHAGPMIIILPENVYLIPTITIVWNGSDNLHGSGIEYFDVQYKAKYIGPGYQTMDLPEWCDLEMNTTNTSNYFCAYTDYIYYFRCRAVDCAGNVEAWPALWDSVCVVKEVHPQTYQELVDQLEERVEQKKDRVWELIYKHQRMPIVPPIPEFYQHRPISWVNKLFPIHIWIDEMFFIQDEGVVSIQVYPYPPSYYLIDWLEEQDILSMNSYYASFEVSWVGNDQGNESCVKCFDVQYRAPRFGNLYSNEFAPNDPLSWVTWLDNTTETDEIFRAESGGLYQFRCRAYDRNDNVEQYPITADTSVYVLDLRMTDTY